MQPIHGALLLGLGIIAGTYILLKHSGNVGTIAQGGTAAYGNVVKTFGQGPKVP